MCTCSVAAVPTAHFHSLVQDVAGKSPGADGRYTKKRSKSSTGSKETPGIGIRQHHGWSCRWYVSSCSGVSLLGAPTSTSSPRPLLGNAMTSRTDSAPSMTAIEAVEAERDARVRRTAGAQHIDQVAEVFDALAGQPQHVAEHVLLHQPLWMRRLPPPSSTPLHTRS